MTKAHVTESGKSSIPARLWRRMEASTLWYRRLRTDKDPRYAIANLQRLQEQYTDMNASERLDADEWIVKIVSHLAMSNGTVMASSRGRHAAAIEKFIEEFGARLPRELRVLEIGCSLGIDGLEIYRKLGRVTRVASYCLADLHTQLQFDQRHQLAYDDDGELVQAFIDQRAISVHVSNYFRWTKWLMALFNLQYVRRARRLAAQAAGSPTAVVYLLHPEVLELVRIGDLTPMRQDVMKPIPGSYDLIISFNLLITAYFGAEELRTAIRNILGCMAEGAHLILGRENTDFSVFAKSGNRLSLAYRHGRGSDCDSLIAGLEA